MTTYKGIHGLKVQHVTSDSAASGVAGGSWSSGGNVNTARYAGQGSGTQTAALATGGFEPSTSAKNESYNGTSWTEVGDLNTARGQSFQA